MGKGWLNLSVLLLTVSAAIGCGTVLNLGPVDEVDAGPGICDHGTVPVGTTRCSDARTMETCGADGTWSTHACGDALACSDGTCQDPPSCRGAAETQTCGPTGDESCCTSPLVPGGPFRRDAVANTATVSSFRLDKYEATVGRYRQFVHAVFANGTVWTPPEGSGKHAHINAGQGVTNASFTELDSGVPYEYGWSPLWNSATDYVFFKDKLAGGWVGHLNDEKFCATTKTWSDAPGDNDTLPMTCVNWFEAYAFCIWDGGFLPTEAELNYAAAGGSEHRTYPWSSPPTSGVIDAKHVNYCADQSTGKCANKPTHVGAFPAGNGRWGHADIAGNVDEWVLDTSDLKFPASCTDCASMAPSNDATGRTDRSGTFWDPATKMLASFYEPQAAYVHYDDFGVRCARAP
jgi:formylglycine-generating enzyme required for sulfatase activity